MITLKKTTKVMHKMIISAKALHRRSSLRLSLHPLKIHPEIHVKSGQSAREQNRVSNFNPASQSSFIGLEIKIEPVR